MTPVVSVLMPVYNRADRVALAVESILAQRYGDFELIVVDDGSTDGTADVVAAIRDPRIRFLRRLHAGCVPALAAAVAASVGRFLTRQDADDVSHPDRLLLQTRFLEWNPHVAMVGGDYELIDGEGRLLRRVFTLTRDDQIRRTFLATLPFCGPLVMVRSAAAAEAGGFVDERLAAFEDPDLCYRVAVRFPVANLPEAIYQYRRDGSNISAKDWHRREVEARWKVLRDRHAAAGALELDPVEDSALPVDWPEDPHGAERERLYHLLRYEIGYRLLLYGRSRPGLAAMREACAAKQLTFGKWICYRIAQVWPDASVRLRAWVDSRRHHEAF